MSAVPVGAEPARLLTPRFLTVVASGLCYFTALALVLPVLPQYVEGPLEGGSLSVGIAVGIFAFGAVVLRPYAGRIGDRAGRRVLIVGGALIVAATTLLYGVHASLAWLVPVRFLTGVGEAAFFVGAATMITDLAPIERRGEAISYWSVAVYGGVAFGPVLGEWLLGDDHYTRVWVASAGFALVAAALGMATVDPPRSGPPRKGPLLYRQAIAPGVVLFCGLVALAGYTAFVPLYVDELGLGGAGGILLLYGVVILTIRILGARVPDRLGGRRAGAIALSLGALGTATMALWGTVAGLVVGTVVFALGMSLLYPAFLLLALAGVPDNERASSVGTISSFFDLSQGLGAPICGLAVALAGDDRAAFAAGSAIALIGLVILLADRARRRAAPVAGFEHPAEECRPT